jgi:hypothetical protein
MSTATKSSISTATRNLKAQRAAARHTIPRPLSLADNTCGHLNHLVAGESHSSHIGLCRVCYTDAHAMVVSGEITWDLLEDMGIKGIGPKLQYLIDLDRELKAERAAELMDDLGGK